MRVVSGDEHQSMRKDTHTQNVIEHAVQEHFDT